MAGEPDHGTAPERRGGGGLFVGQDLGVSQSGVVVQGSVQEVVAAGAGGLAGAAGQTAVLLADAASVDAVPAAGRDLPELLDVDMDQLTGPLALVPLDLTA